MLRPLCWAPWPAWVVADMGGHARGFVEHGEVESVGARLVGIMGARDGDRASFWQIDGPCGFVDDDVFCGLSGVYELGPDLACHEVAGGDPPAALALQARRPQDVDQAQCRFAPAPPAGQHIEGGRSAAGFHRLGVGHASGHRRRHIGCGWVVPSPFGRPAADLQSSFPVDGLD